MPLLLLVAPNTPGRMADWVSLHLFKRWRNHRIRGSQSPDIYLMSHCALLACQFSSSWRPWVKWMPILSVCWHSEQDFDPHQVLRFRLSCGRVPRPLLFLRWGAQPELILEKPASPHSAPLRSRFVRLYGAMCWKAAFAKPIAVIK